MKFPYISGLVAGGLIVGGAVLLASPNTRRDTETGATHINEDLQERIAILNTEVQDLIELGKSITEEVKKYLNEKIPPLVNRIEELNIDLNVYCEKAKEILLDLVNALWNLWDRAINSFS